MIFLENSALIQFKTLSKIAFISCYGLAKNIGEVLLHVFSYILREIHAMEILFANMSNLYSFLCQLLFFTLCEIVIIGESDKFNNQGVAGLSTLLFYTIFGYFVSKINDICENNLNRTRVRYSITHYFRWFIKIVLEWAKAIAVVLCIKDRGIDYEADTLYTLITFFYYVCTEKLFRNLLIKLVSYFNFTILDSMEHLYVPIVLNIFAIISAFWVTLIMTVHPHMLYALFASYFILYLRLKDLYYNYIKTLIAETQAFQSFRSATVNDLEDWDDICAVCLTRMSKATITPCNHLFHPSCLKQCLRMSLLCPLCKHNFIQ